MIAPLLPLNLNSPEINKVADELGMTVPDFVELSILAQMGTSRMFPEEYKGKGMALLTSFRVVRRLINLLHQLPIDEQRNLVESDPIYAKMKITSEE